MVYLQLVISCLLAILSLGILILLRYPWVKHDLDYIYRIIKCIIYMKKMEKNKKTLVDVFQENADLRPQKTFVIFKDEQYSYRYMEEKMNKVAHVGLKLGMKPGDIVAMLMPNEPAFIWTAYGLSKIGVQAAYLNFNLRSKPLLHCFKVSGSKILIVDQNEELLKAVQDIYPDLQDLGVRIYVHGAPVSASLPSGFSTLTTLMERASIARPSASYRADVTLSTPICYIYTSGTTGLPKAAVITLSRVIKGALLMSFIQPTADDILYTPLPLYHSAGGLVILGTVVAYGSTLVLRGKFSASSFMDDCRKHRVTIIHYIGELCRYLCARPKSDSDGDHCIRAAFGNGLRQDIWQEFQTRFKIPLIEEVYAATEGAAGFVNYFNKVGSCGRNSPLLNKLVPSYFVEYDIARDLPVRNQAGFCIPVKQNQAGLMVVQVKENTTFDGYLGARDITDKKLLRNVFTDGDVFFNTGDIMEMDDEYFVYFKDRVGDTFRWKGENVSTIEVSNVLTNVEPIHDASVFGVEIPGQDGRAGMAALSLTSGSDLSTSQLQTLYRHCEDLLPGYAIPRFLRAQKEVEITSTFKQRKITLMREGFNPELCGGDPMYCISFSDKTFVPLTKAIYESILAGQIRL